MSSRVPNVQPKKLTPFLGSGELIDRSHLLQLLTAHKGRKCSVIQAPMGSGKTVLLSQFYKEQTTTRPTAWLSLDKDDVEPARFFLHLSQAIQKAIPEFNRQVIYQTDHAAPSQSRILTRLFMDGLNSLSVAPIVIIDNLHFLQNSPWRDTLVQLIEESQHCYWLLADRNQNTLNTGSWKNNPAYFFIDQNQLYFNEQELRDFLQRTNTDSDIEPFCNLIQRYTQGWPAGIKLGQLYLNNVGSTFTIDNNVNGMQLFREIANKVIDSLPEETQYFLVNTCFLDHFNLDLCSSVICRSNCESILSELEDTAFFIEKASNEDLCYQYHPYIRKLLQERFQTQNSDFNNRLISKASLWLTENNYRELACKTAEQHSVNSYFTEYLRQCFVHWLRQGQVKSIFNWFHEHQDSQLLDVEEIKISWCWALTLSGDINAAEQALQQHFPTEITEGSALVANTQVLLATIRLFKNEISNETKALLNELYKQAYVSNEIRASINNVFAQHYTNIGDFVLAQEYAEKAYRISEQQDNVFTLAITVYIKVRLLYLNNDIHQALAECEHHLTSNQFQSQPVVQSLLGSLKVYLHYISDNPPHTQHLSYQLLSHCEPGLSIDLQYYLYTPILRTQIREGNLQAAVEMLEFLEATARSSGSHLYIAEVLYEKIRFAIITDNQSKLEELQVEFNILDYANQYLTDKSQPWATRERYIKSAIILLISKKQYDQASKLAFELLSLNVEQGYPISHLPISALHAWLNFCQGQRNMAFTRVNAILDQAEPSGLLLGLFDDIPNVAEMLNQAIAENQILNPTHLEKLLQVGFGE